MRPSEKYNEKLTNGALNADPAQSIALKAFDAIAEALERPQKTWWGFGGAGRSSHKGLYLYGGVGRGKSMLMDLFFDCLETPQKRRVHFHAFMAEVHDALHLIRKSGVSDAIRPVAKEIAQNIQVLCFDEMQILDIADAMIVGRLFEALFDAGVTIVTTSNRHPKDLYKDGLNRHLFLPFIALLEDRLTIHALDGETDYRQKHLSERRTYFSPLNAETQAQIDALWGSFNLKDPEPLKVTVKTRSVSLPLYSAGVGRAGFGELCEKPLGASDYLALMTHLRVLFLENVPKLSEGDASAAKRFVTLIDTAYEAGIALIIGADAPAEQLYEKGRGAFEFERTASRLVEMTSGG